MKICVIGTGYVGLVTGACLAEMGNQVICVDLDEERIENLKSRKALPFYEPGLREIVGVNSREGRLRFTTDTAQAVLESELCFIAVGTPQGADGSADLTAVFAVARDIGRAMDGYRVVVTKSTVPVGTCARIEKVVAEETDQPFSVVSNPEFLKQGNAVGDFLKPDRVVIGANDRRAEELMKELYSPFLRTGKPVICMDVASSEMTKYVANAFLATKISFINEVANLCDVVGADIELVRSGICTDSRIGPHFLFPGVGYGGSCFPKDVKALIQTASQNDVDCAILRATDSVNVTQPERFFLQISSYFGSLSGRTIAIWGLSFKPNTDDMREAPSLKIVASLLEAGAKVRAFDPRAEKQARRHFGESVVLCGSSYEALEGADALVILTEWNEFRRPDFDKMGRLLKQPVLFDGRNLFEPARVRERGFVYRCVGRNPQSVPASK